MYYSFLLCMLLPIFWCSGQLYEVLLGKQQSGPVFFMEYFSVCFGAYVWLLFCMNYTAKSTVKVSTTFLLAIPGMILYLFVLTNDFHNAFTYFENGFRKYGILFKINFCVFLLYTFTGICLLIRYSYKKRIKTQIPSYLLVVSFLIPVILTSIKVSGKVRFDIVGSGFLRRDFDLSSVSFLATMLIFTVSFFKYRFMNITPFAMRHIFDSVSDAVMVINENNEIVAVNKSFKSSFPEFLKSDGQESAVSFSQYLNGFSVNTDDDNSIIDRIAEKTDCELSNEICIDMQGEQFYKVSISPIIYDKDCIGRTVSFSNISDYRNLLGNLNMKNNELEKLNEKLKEMNRNIILANKRIKDYANTARELAVAKERNRFAQDVHDTLGHNQVILITLLEACRLTLYEKPSKSDNILTEALYTARKGLQEIRSSINKLVDEELKDGYSLEKLEELMMEFEITGVKIDFLSDEGIEDIGPDLLEVLYRVCREAMTNSVRHGMATHISFVLKILERSLKLHIFDNGVGCRDIKHGMGLKGMEQCVTELGGNINFASSPDNGFKITLEIPL